MTDSIPAGRIDLLLDRLNRSRVGSDTRMQCKVCWHVYDPAEGEPDMEIPPGTPFNELPEHFTCPGCGNSLTSFIPCPEDEYDS